MCRSVVLMAAILGTSTSAIARAQMPEPREVKVLVLNFDPIVQKNPVIRLHQECRWQDPRVLAKGYADDVKKASGGLIRYRVVDWQDLDEFTIKTDGFTYTMAEYLRCHRAGKGWHVPDGTDYPKLIAKHKIVPRIEKGEIDEVWWFGAPYCGFYESAMAGKGAFYVNGGVFGPDKVPCKRAFVIMGFNYERGVAEMLHDLCHRTESTMSRIYGGWKIDQLDTDWARFAANSKQSNGVAGAGTCHYPPNADADYDYANKRFVESSADDWLNFPSLKGTRTKLNCEAWGGPDYHRNYVNWWFARLPRAAGVNAKSRRLNNWWEYVFNFNAYDDRGRPVSSYDPAAERHAAELVVKAGGTVNLVWEGKVLDGIRTLEKIPKGDLELAGIGIEGGKGVGELLLNVGLPKLHAFHSVWVVGSDVDDEGLKVLAGASKLRDVNLTRTRVTDLGLAHLAGLEELATLRANGIAIGDAGFKHLSRIPNLAFVEASETQLSDAGLMHVGAMSKLGELHVGNTKISDAGLRSLEGLRNLRVLSVVQTNVTAAGVEGLKKALPNLQVFR